MSKSIYDIRLDNLRLLIRQWESAVSLAKELGHSNSSFLGQLAGPNPTRTISEKVARKIEKTLNLSEGWMDESHSPENALQTSDDFLLACVAMVTACIQDARLTLNPEETAEITYLAWDDAKAKGRLDRRYVQTLVNVLTKRKH